MSKRQLPDKWARRLIERGFTDPRYAHDVASMGALATKTGVHTSTISAAIHGGRGRPSIETVRILAHELGDDVAEWLGVPLREPFQPPAEADLLTTRQRKAVTELIRSIVAAEQEGVMGNAQHPAATSRVIDEEGSTGEGST